MIAPVLWLGSFCSWIGAAGGKYLQGEGFGYCLLAAVFFWLWLLFFRKGTNWILLPYAGFSFTVGMLFQFTRQQELVWGMPALSFGLGMFYWKKSSWPHLSPFVVWMLWGICLLGLVAGWFLDWIASLPPKWALIWLMIGIGYTLISSKLIAWRAMRSQFDRRLLVYSCDLFLLSTNMLFLVSRVLP